MAAESYTRAQVTRRFEASPERVFDAWLDPVWVRKFFFTSDPSMGYSEGQDVRNDPRVGGTYRVMDRREGKEYVAEGEYLEIDRLRRLVFTFRMPQFSDSEDRVAVEITPVEGGCELTLTQEIVVPREWLRTVLGKAEPLTPGEIERGLIEVARETEKGWRQMLEFLALALAGSGT